jgi:hypothetical protein
VSGSIPKRGHWYAVRPRQGRAASRSAYREPAPDPAWRPPPMLEESGAYQALREHWLVTWIRRFLGR